MVGLPHSSPLCPILVMLSAKLGNDINQVLYPWFVSTRVRTHEVRISQSPRSVRIMVHASFGGGIENDNGLDEDPSD